MNFAKFAVLPVITLFCALSIHAQERHIIGTLETFYGTNGGSPYGSLMRGRDGNLYGIASIGGPKGGGAIFEVTTNNTFTNLAYFAGTNGSFPAGNLLETTNFVFYGSTYFGGTNSVGTIFKYSTNSGLQHLFSFNGTNGAYPWGGLTQASNGNLYGTTTSGGPTFSISSGGHGSIFVLTTNGVISNLYYFTNGADGAVPYGSLVEGTNGDLYGTTSSGGAHGGGTIYRWRLDPGLDVIASLGDPNGPYSPSVGLTKTRRGTFLGTSSEGGIYGQGTIFEMTYAGQVTVVHNFAGYPTDGATPYSPVSCCCCCCDCCDYYGTTYNGGSGSNGIIYRVSFNTNGFSRYLIIHNFRNLVDGGSPEGAIVANRYGNLYGTAITGGGGPMPEGTVFEIFTRPRPERISFSNGALTGTLEDVNPGVSYKWQFSHTLQPGSWADLGTPMVTWSNRLDLNFTVGAQHNFYRAQIMFPTGISF